MIQHESDGQKYYEGRNIFYKTTLYQRRKGNEYYQNHRTEELTKDKIRRLANLEHYRKKDRIMRQKYRFGLIQLLGAECKKCGYKKDLRALQIDHKQGRGSKDARRFSNPLQMYRYYLSKPDLAKRKLQTLCANCNIIKTFIKNEGKVVSFEEIKQATQLPIIKVRM